MRTRETTFHRVTYAEADELRAAILHYVGPGPEDHGCPRVFCVCIARTPVGRGVRCRECGERLPQRRRAIQFAFQPHYGQTDQRTGDRDDGHITANAWLHLERCPTARQR